jgi:hypothetical protein
MSSTWYLFRLSMSGSYTIPVYITIRMVRYRPTLWSSALLSLLEPHKSNMHQCCSMLAHQGPNDAVLNQQKQGLPPWSLEYPWIHSPTFPFGDTPLVVPYFPRICLNLRQLLFIKIETNLQPPLWQGILHARGTYHSSSTVSLYTNHSSVNDIQLQKVQG